jgi:beta-N-acetylhexosaminidase
VTDAMEMQGVAGLYSQGEAAVRAVEAGADVLLMPTDPEACIRALTQAVERGRISRQRIDASAAKILNAKRRVGLFRTRFVNLDALTDSLDEQKLEPLAQGVADRALTLVKDDGRLFPVPSGEGSCVVILGERPFSQRGEVLLNELQRRKAGLASYVVDPSVPQRVLAAITEDASKCKQIYMAAFVTVAAYRGSVALEGGLSSFVNALVHGPAPVALIAFGSPYLLRDFPNVPSYLATFSSAVTSEKAVAKAMAGEIRIGGRLPISIPGVASLGAGLDVPAKATSASNGS